MNAGGVAKALYIVGGSVALALAVVGIFVPGLPITPLALLSAALYSKGSDKLYNRLLANKFLGPKIKGYKSRGGLGRRQKVRVIALMSAMVLFSSLVVLEGRLVLQAVTIGLGIVGGLFVWFAVPRAKDE